MSEGFHFDQYGAVDQVHARQMARDPDVKPLYLRVMFAAIGWSNLIGHAEFAQSGLAVVLQTNDPRTGELSIPSARQVNAAIERAREMTLVSDTSSRFCLVAPPWWHKAGGKGGRSCTYHGIKSRAYRDKRSPDISGDRDKRGPALGQEKSRPKPLTCGNTKPLYDSVLPQQPANLPPAERAAS